jgi:hypothetical protein
MGDRLFPQRARHPFVPQPESLADFSKRRVYILPSSTRMRSMMTMRPSPPEG